MEFFPLTRKWNNTKSFFPTKQHIKLFQSSFQVSLVYFPLKFVSELCYNCFKVKIDNGNVRDCKIKAPVVVTRYAISWTLCSLPQNRHSTIMLSFMNVINDLQRCVFHKIRLNSKYHEYLHLTYLQIKLTYLLPHCLVHMKIQ